MKKVLMILAVTMFTLTSFSQESEVSKTINQISDLKDSTVKDLKEVAATVDTSSISKQIYHDAKEGIMGLAAALKVGAEHVYMVLVKQQVVHAITWLILGIIPLLLLLIFSKSVYQWAAKNASETEGFSIFVAALFFVPCIIMLIVGLFYIDVIVTGFVNPEYGAMQEIMNWVK